MKKSNRTRYKAVENGYEVIGSRETFNRTLYGSHAKDDLKERYFTFAGDLPLFMGSVTDYSKHTACHYAKNGVLMNGLALTPGVKMPHFYSSDIDIGSRWFHKAEDTVAVFRNGWMEYELCQFSPWFPDVNVKISTFPLMPENGFLVHYRIKTDQRVIFCAGFGGITDFIGRFEYHEASVRNFHASDCSANIVTCGKDRALVKGATGALWIGSSFPVDVEKGDAFCLENSMPGEFIGTEADENASHVVKMSSVIEQGKTFEGFLVVIRNEPEDVLDKWLNHEDPVSYLKEQIHAKKSCISMYTPDSMLNLTVPPTVLSIDASWHGRTFCHGAHGYHSPFLGWRNWYGPTVIGWQDRVKKAIQSHFAQIVKKAFGEEAVWYDGKDRPDLDHEGTQYHQIRNSTGFIPCILDAHDIYNMQEVAVDMLLHYLEWTGDFEFARELFESLKDVLEWEARILDPDNDGLYQNFLNTWISDGHSYNGGGCAQASAYNYHANLMMTKIAEKLNLPSGNFEKRAAGIFKAVNEKLWLSSKGVIAEYVDTVGNKLAHPSPELSTIYLSIESGLADMFQAYRMLRFTETDLRNERTLNSDGRLLYSSNWLPKKYSTCGLFPAENIHLALVYFQLGLKEKGLEILDALKDSYFNGRSPGLTSHVLTGYGAGDLGDLDFSDVTSMYLRLVVEGLYGIRFHLIDGYIEVAPNFPVDWTTANLKLKDISLNYYRDGSQENFNLFTEITASKKLRIAMRATDIEAIFLNGEPVEYKMEASVNNSFLTIETNLTGQIHLQVIHGGTIVPCITATSPKVIQGNEFFIELSHGKFIDWRDDSGVLDNISFVENKVYAKAAGIPGNYTLFLRVKTGLFDSWLAADFSIEQKAVVKKILSCDNQNFEPLDISSYFNTSTSELHTLEYKSPRPAGYSIGVRINGRYAWEWNHCGHNAVEIDDCALRNVRGTFVTPSGIKFSTPETGHNLACASIWDNFPTVLNIPLKGKGSELALFFIGVTNAMQSRVENARISVTYANGERESVSLIHPVSFDDWLVPALQTENETVYFSDYNHGIVQRISLDPKKELLGISIEVIANEVIIGLLGISIKISKGEG